MRSITMIILGGFMAVAPLSAKASVETCATSLLRSNDLMGELQLTSWQARQLQAIRDETERQQSTILAQLEHVRPALSHARATNDETGRVQRLEARETALVARFDGAAAAASGTISGLLTAWQRNRCNGAPPPPPPPAAPAAAVTWRLGPFGSVSIRLPRIVAKAPKIVVRAAPPRPMPPPAKHKAPPHEPGPVKGWSKAGTGPQHKPHA